MHPTSPYCGAKCDEIGESPSIGECACVPPPIVHQNAHWPMFACSDRSCAHYHLPLDCIGEE